MGCWMRTATAESRAQSPKAQPISVADVTTPSHLHLGLHHPDHTTTSPSPLHIALPFVRCTPTFPRLPCRCRDSRRATQAPFHPCRAWTHPAAARCCTSLRSVLPDPVPSNLRPVLGPRLTPSAGSHADFDLGITHNPISHIAGLSVARDR
jgi:hypothetical protein